jgi:glycosyltransferase involved in cell wall biosynthesis
MWPDAQVAAFAAGVLSRTVTVWAIRGEAEAALAERASVARRLLSRLRRQLLRRTTHVALTPSMAEELAANGVIAPVVIPVPVDRRHFRPPSAQERAEARRTLGIEPQSFAVVYVGHLEARKAVDRLIEAFGLLVEAVPSARLLLIGGGRGTREDTEVALRRLVSELGLDAAVTFCGVRPDPRPYLWAADALALASLREGMPNSLLEGMACGLPCVAPASAGGDEVLDAGTGIVPSSNEPAELAEALERLASDLPLREELGRTAQARVQRYDIESVAVAYERVFARLAPGGSS